MTRIRTISSREEEEERRSKKEEKKAKKKQKKELKKEKKLAEKNAKNKGKVVGKTQSTKQKKEAAKTPHDNGTNNEVTGAEKPVVASTNKIDNPTNGSTKEDVSMTTNDKKKIVEEDQENQNEVKISEIAEINEPLTVDVKIPPTDEKRSSEKGIKSPIKLKKYIKGKSSNKSENSQPGTPVSHKSIDSVFEKDKSKKKKLKLSWKPRKKKSKSEDSKNGGKGSSPVITQVEKIESKSNKEPTNDEVDQNVFLFNDTKSNAEVNVVAYKRTPQQTVEATTSGSMDDQKQRLSPTKNKDETQEIKTPNETEAKVSTIKSFTSSINRTLTPKDMKKAKKKAKTQRTLQKEKDLKYANEMNAKSTAGTNSEDQLQSLICSTKETAAIMRDNVGKVIDREENLEQLYITTRNMEDSSEKFIRSSKKVKKKHKCKSKCPCCWPCYRELCCITAVE